MTAASTDPTGKTVFRGDPLIRHQQGVAADQFRLAYEAHQDAETAARRVAEARAVYDRLIAKRDGCLALISELRFNYHEAAMVLRASNDEYARVDLDEFVEAMRRLTLTSCTACARLTREARLADGGDPGAVVNCTGHGGHV